MTQLAVSENSIIPKKRATFNESFSRADKEVWSLYWLRFNIVVIEPGKELYSSIYIRGHIRAAGSSNFEIISNDIVEKEKKI